MENHGPNCGSTEAPPEVQQTEGCFLPRSDTWLAKSHTEFMTSKTSTSPIQSESCNIKEYDNDILGEGDTVQVNLKMNEVFMRRIHDIDTKAGNNLELKLITYQEWVDTLLFINEKLLSCIVNLESGIAMHVAKDDPSVKSELPNFQEQTDPHTHELAMLRRDIKRLLTLVKCGYHYQSWDVNSHQFESIDRDTILKEEELVKRSMSGMQSALEHRSSSVRFNPNEQTNRTDANVKALTFEVADKHDEIRNLKQQINSLEEEIQNAQKRIQLKDNVVRELRADLKTKSLEHCKLSFEKNKMLSVRTHEDFSSNDYIHISAESSEVIGKECEALLSTKNVTMQHHRKHITDILYRAENDKLEYQRRYNNLLAILADIEKSCALVDTDAYANIEDRLESPDAEGQEMQLVNGLRKRLLKLHEVISQFKNLVQLMNNEKNDIYNKLITEKNITKHNSKTLSEIATLLYKLTNHHISYDAVYIQKSSGNPFCECIKSMANNFANIEKELQFKLENSNCKINSLKNKMMENDQIARERNQVENQNLKIQIEELNELLRQKEEEINHLSKDGQLKTGQLRERDTRGWRRKDGLYHDLQREVHIAKEKEKCLQSENIKLTNDLVRAKKKKVDLKSRILCCEKKLSAAETRDIEKEHKITELESSLERAKAQLHKSDNRLEMCQRTHDVLEKRVWEAEAKSQKERKELFEFKQHMAAQSGENSTLKKHLDNNNQEIAGLIIKCQNLQSDLHKKEQEIIVRDTRQRHYITDLKMKLSKLLAEKNELEEAYKSADQIREADASIIEQYRKWREEQLNKNEKTHMHIQNLNQHIKLLMENRESTQEMCMKLCTDNEVLRNEINLIIPDSRASYTGNRITGNNSLAQRYSMVNDTLWKITTQLTTLNNASSQPT